MAITLSIHDPLRELRADAAQWLLVAKHWSITPGGEWDLTDNQQRSQYRVWRSALAQSCELFLKFLHLVSNNGPHMRTHKLQELYEALPNEARADLENAWAANSHPSVTVTCYAILPGPPSDREFPSIHVPDSCLGYLTLLDEGQADMRYDISRHQYEKFVPGAVIIGISKEMVFVAENLQRHADAIVTTDPL